MTDETPNMRLGRFAKTTVSGETVFAFVPPPLPPMPPVDVLPLLGKLSAAERALGRLDGITMLLPRQSYCRVWCLRLVGHAAIWSGLVASIPSLNVTPVMTLAR